MAAINLTDLKNELDSAVDGAVDFVDLVDKFADTIRPYASLIPGAGSELTAIIGPLDAADKALHELKSILGA